MGGHGGLNILPQKKWNVYNFENREKVRKDEEAAAKEEQIKREQSRKRDAEFRLQKLRFAKAEIKESGGKDLEEEKGFKRKKLKRDEEKKKEDKVVVSAEDEKYKLGYGLAGKGVKAPWYLTKPVSVDGDDEIGGKKDRKKQEKKNNSGKKMVEELREERLKREKREKEREFALIRDKNKRKDGFGYKVRSSY
ncbi:leukocyte receptor cluster-like protein [Thalictrum thalictroides]|uniref:Leukocyte receptor cluster-like protein n=1 Tax=Thalictrum thalictroides TaxID=46969 RepID=A0A7J6VZH5_THATH|nr:leukocyte receptor cluster-like protein [Thalictrum thalictroides]